MIAARFLAAVASALGDEVVAARALGGGDVARAHRVELASGRTVFAKTQDRPPPGCFVTEAASLQWLRSAEAIDVPEVLAVADGGGPSDGGPVALLVLEWVDEARGARSDDRAFGRALAELHRAGAPCFGRADRRTTGSRSLPNDPAEHWAEFYAGRRLLPLVRHARDSGALSVRTVRGIEAIAGRLERFGATDEPPARLHGDLWAGNRIVDDKGASWLIDPAAHGGHREFDLAMMRLFGGFDPVAFDGYAEVHPLADGWSERVPLHQLAPLMVHAIKFGGGYVGATERAVAQLT